ncbi:MAG: phosphoenolpyruvate--protein phosphotransferase [Clostridia bacterium]|nr:phosphoenolpyruvate--protein phosphotransferase [Clostridia bacterium]
MIEINGKSVYNSLAMGKLYFLNKEKDPVKRVKISDIRKEVLRVEEARRIAKNELRELYEKALVSVGEANAQVFQIHIMMLEDEDFFGAITSMIGMQNINAEFAVIHTSEVFARTFGNMADEYMRARAADVQDIADRLLNILLGKDKDDDKISQNSIIVASDLTPSETVRLDKDKIAGFVTFRGSQTSHTSILARTMNLPAIINTGVISAEYHGRTAILDGYSGTLYIDPDNDKIEDFKHRKKLEDERAELLRTLHGKTTETKSGRRIKLYANISYPQDLREVLANDAEGIGLFRSEFLYLENQDFPTEDQQFVKYKEVAEALGGKTVIIRTLDIGADKKIGYFNLPQEENPALGYRAIRICLSDIKLFKTQLRAILRASAFGNISVMFPMIVSQSEVRRAKSCLKECMQELKSEGIPFNPKIEVGIMIETPAAAIISDLLAEEVDFFSIGTNDLTQYTLAADRQNSRLEDFVDARHESIIRLIELTVKNAHRKGKWVGICGELATDEQLCKRFVDMGVDELSVAPSQVLKVREKIRNLD